MATARLLAPKATAPALHFGIRRVSTGRWQYCLKQGEKFIIRWNGEWRGPHGEEHCLEAIALVRSTGEDTPLLRELSY